LGLNLQCGRVTLQQQQQHRQQGYVSDIA
jgi:hypothetical protein